MTTEEIKKNAPIGATHFVEHNGRLRYIKDDFESSSCFMWDKDDIYQYYWFWLPMPIDVIKNIKPL